MALQKTITTSSGVTVQNAYHRIDTFNGNKSEMVLDVKTYVSKEAYLSGVAYVGTPKYYTVPVSIEEGAENPLKQGYEELKKIADFAGAIDV